MMPQFIVVIAISFISILSLHFLVVITFYTLVLQDLALYTKMGETKRNPRKKRSSILKKNYQKENSISNIDCQSIRHPHQLWKGLPQPLVSLTPEFEQEWQSASVRPGAGLPMRMRMRMMMMQMVLLIIKKSLSFRGWCCCCCWLFSADAVDVEKLLIVDKTLWYCILKSCLFHVLINLLLKQQPSIQDPHFGLPPSTSRHCLTIHKNGEKGIVINTATITCCCPMLFSI